MGINFQKLGEEMRATLTDADWAALDSLRARGIAVAFFLPHEMDGVAPAEVMLAATRGAYDHIAKHGQAAQALAAARRAMAELKNNQ